MRAFEQTLTSSLFSTPILDKTVHVGGWLTSARFQKKVGFLVLMDGSSQLPLQIVIPEALLIEDPSLRTLGAGFSIQASGQLVASKGAGQAWELLAESVTLIGAVDTPETYPIQPKYHSPEFLRSLPHLRPRVTRFGAIARLRHVLMETIHHYLSEQGFLWIATPILSTADTEGAGEQFMVTTSLDDPTEFFGKETFLSVSGQLDVEAFCMALSRVYTFGPTFRAEKSQTSRHLAEFWMVEPEMAFASLDDIADLAEGLLKTCIKVVLEKLPEEMNYFEKEGGKSIQQWKALAQDAFERLTYTRAVELLQTSKQIFQFPVAWGVDLQSEHEKALVEMIGRPVILTDYPKGIKAFYMKESVDGKTVEAMDILVDGVGEIIGGSAREESLEKLVSKMQSLSMDIEEYRPYLDLRKYGSVSHAGFGLGFERLVAYLSSSPSVKDVIPYPRSYKSI